MFKVVFIVMCVLAVAVNIVAIVANNVMHKRMDELAKAKKTE